MSFAVKRIATDVLLFFTDFVYIINRKIHGCLEIPDLFLVLNHRRPRLDLPAPACAFLITREGRKH
jgi:hypothetical protein